MKGTSIFGGLLTANEYHPAAWIEFAITACSGAPATFLSLDKTP